MTDLLSTRIIMIIIILKMGDGNDLMLLVTINMHVHVEGIKSSPSYNLCFLIITNVNVIHLLCSQVAIQKLKTTASIS